MAQKKNNKKVANEKVTKKKVNAKVSPKKESVKPSKKVEKKVAKKVVNKKVDAKASSKKEVVKTSKKVNTVSANKNETTKTKQVKEKNIDSVKEEKNENKAATQSEKEIVLIEPYKRPSRLNYFWIIPLLLIFLVGIAVPAGFYFITIHDTSTKEVAATGNLDVNEIMTNLFTNSITNINTEGHEGYSKMLIDINDKTLDEVAMTARNKIVEKDAQLATIMPKMYFTIKDNQYNLYADINIVDTIRTRIGILSTLTEDEGEDPKNPACIFKINSINLGRFGVPPFLQNFIKSFINTQSLNDMFKNIGITATFDIDNMRIIYKRSDFVNDIKKFANKSLGDKNVLVNLFSSIIQDKLDVDTTGSIAFKIDLSDFNQREDIKPKRNTIIAVDKLNDYRQKIITLLDNGTIAGTKEEMTKTANQVFMFLQHGYYTDEAAISAGLNDYFYNPIKDIDLSSINIPNKTEYAPSDELHNNVIYSLQDTIKKALPAEEELLSKIVSFISDASQKEFTITSIEDENFYNFSKSLTLLGNTTFLISKGTDDKYIANYITINNADFVFDKVDNKDVMRMFVDISINGYRIEAIVNMSPIFDITKKTLQCKIDNVFLGKQTLEDEPKKALIEFIASGNNIKPSGDTTFNINPSVPSVDINFSPIYDGLPDTVKNVIEEFIKEDTGGGHLNFKIANNKLELIIEKNS